MSKLGILNISGSASPLNGVFSPSLHASPTISLEAIMAGTYKRTPETLKKQSEAAKKFRRENPDFCRGPNHPMWKGGKIIREGYVYIREPEHPNNNGGYVPEHRLSMENHIGRLLESWEVVHHINGKRDDNRIENLLLLPDHPHHHAIETLLKENKKLKQEIKKLKGE